MEAVVLLTAKAEIAYGEDLLVCGSAPALGSWKVADAPAMTWSDGGRWTLQVGLPCGVIVEMKILVRQQGGALRWVGAGATGESNVLLETSLGRGGARASRFIGDALLPFALEVADVDVEVVPPSPADAPQQHQPPQQVAQPPAGVVATPLGFPGAPGGMVPYGQPMAMAPMGYAPYPPPQAYPPQQAESAAAAMLAGAAGAAALSAAGLATMLSARERLAQRGAAAALLGDSPGV
mmetsp:Transcript_90972/g.262236  ORF Transcript_90972/g.262236 Transcript_90972/m.262236 type:complete len:236 (-) Transcript_90972:232-939(-)